METHTLTCILDGIEEEEDDDDDVQSDVDEFDDLQCSLCTLHTGAASTAALVPTAESGTALSTAPRSGNLSLPKLEDVHRQGGTLSNAYSGFKCRCATTSGGSTCVEMLSMVQLKAAYSSLHPDGESTSPTKYREELHKLLWSRKRALPTPNSRGHNYEIVDWSYDGKPLCRAGFMKVFGGTYQAHRDMYANVLRGISPADVACKTGALLLSRTRAKQQSARSAKDAYATTWLSEKYLAVMEFMPNERRIVLRGVSLQIIHKKLYSPHAAGLNLRLSFKQFRLCLPAAAVECALAHGEPPEEAAKVRVGRSARHSKFPNCSDCHTLQEDYISAASNPLADPAVVQKKLDDWMAHQGSFMADRHEARRLRNATCLPNSDGRYECDDKCGSHWLFCPVCVGGRDSKATAKRQYEFAVQANVVCGTEGVMRLSIVPKMVATGANFGLSTLLQALWSACRMKDGRNALSRSVFRLLRHTDGGPDNVAKLTHIFHWLLVYVGCWQEVIWFMFKAGHSHTEVADRLSSYAPIGSRAMKKLFESDRSTHVEGGITSFEMLEDKLKETFDNCPEMKEIVYHFANWDINQWLKGAVSFQESAMTQISAVKVYRYTYVGDAPCLNAAGKESNMAAVHGGVRVTYKESLADRAPSPLDDEWAPVHTEVSLDAAGEEVKANRTDRHGVVFVTRPPDLTTEPRREAFPGK